MAFDLYITFSGLCLLTHTGSELLVLLPEIPVGHGGHGDQQDVDYRHVAVLGHHERYRSDLSIPSVRHFVEYELGRGAVTFDRLETDDVLCDPNFDKFKLVNIQAVTGEPPDPRLALVRMSLVKGCVCPSQECEHSRGARWEWLGYVTHLATSINWRIRGVRNQVGGQEGLVVRFTDAAGRERDATLRPVDGQIRMYLFHTPGDERPTHGLPRPVRLEKGDPAPHFALYYGLFPSTTATEVPFFEDDGAEAPVPPFLPSRFMGIRFTCITTSASG